MFSYSGLSKDQCSACAAVWHLWDAGRMCVAALNKRNIDYVVHPSPGHAS
jgi:aromatic-amino-acid transaminase